MFQFLAYSSFFVSMYFAVSGKTSEHRTIGAYAAVVAFALSVVALYLN